MIAGYCAQLGLGARGVLGPDTPGDVGLAFYDETPRAGEGAPDSPATPGSSPSSVTIALDDIALAPLKVDYHRIDSNASSASGGAFPSPPPSTLGCTSG